MIITQIDDKNYLIKIPLGDDCHYYFNDKDEILEFFKIIFNKLIHKYKLCGDVIIDFYLDYEYGIILEVYNKNSVGNDINTKIIFHLECKFLIEVNYFDYIGKNKYLYYYEDKFYDEVKEGQIYDGEVIYDTLEIVDKGIKIRV